MSRFYPEKPRLRAETQTQSGTPDHIHTLKRFCHSVPISLRGWRKTSLVAAAAAVGVLALQVPSGVVDAGDFGAEAVRAPADAPPPAAGRLALRGDVEKKEGLIPPPWRTCPAASAKQWETGTCLRLKKPFLSQLGM